MRRLSLWSDFFGRCTPEQRMREIRLAGFRFSELAWETALDPEAGYFSRPWMERLRRASGAAGVQIPQVHYPITTLSPELRPAASAFAEGKHGYDPELEADFAHPLARRRDFEIRCACDLFELCPVAGITTVVAHPGGSRGVGSRRERLRARDLNIEVFAALAEAAKPHGVTLALENMGRVEGRRQFGSRLRELLDLVETVSAPNLGVCLDTSHAHYMGESIPEAISILGKGLVATHLSDNLGSGDDHLLPCSGSIDWPPVFSALRRSGYQGLLNLEIPGESRGPIEVLRLKARYARQLLQTLLETEGQQSPGP
jgi:sugar phosphate isomerase/epimerase